jgi:hypothetical protein
VPDVLIRGDTVRSPELRHEVPLVIADAFLYAEKDGRRAVIIHSLEIPRVREVAPELEIVPIEQLGSDELYGAGKKGSSSCCVPAASFGSTWRLCRLRSLSPTPITCARTGSRL